jgi:hypothetical protein
MATHYSYFFAGIYVPNHQVSTPRPYTEIGSITAPAKRSYLVVVSHIAQLFHLGSGGVPNIHLTLKSYG